MIKAGILGYGKMGRMIESLATAHEVEIVWTIDKEDQERLTTELLRQADVVIEFSSPHAGYNNVRRCLEAGVPVVSGTTGWQQQLPEAQAFCQSVGGALLWASNFSVGVNLFFALNERLARMLSNWSQYQPTLTEVHHIHKLDAPSGTAVTLAEGIIHENPGYKKWLLGENTETGAVPITALREGEVPGTHTVLWSSPIDEIQIEHKAHSRQGFASGALIAAKWLVGKKGVFTMRDVLGLEVD